MRFDSYKCDNCGHLKQEINHWFSAEEVNVTDGVALVLHPRIYTAEAFKHLCSEACVIAVTQQWMSKIKEAHSPTEGK